MCFNGSNKQKIKIKTLSRWKRRQCFRYGISADEMLHHHGVINALNRLGPSHPAVTSHRCVSSLWRLSNVFDWQQILANDSWNPPFRSVRSTNQVREWWTTVGLAFWPLAKVGAWQDFFLKYLFGGHVNYCFSRKLLRNAVCSCVDFDCIKYELLCRDNRPQSASLAKCPVLQSIPGREQRWFPPHNLNNCV